MQERDYLQVKDRWGNGQGVNELLYNALFFVCGPGWNKFKINSGFDRFSISFLILLLCNVCVGNECISAQTQWRENVLAFSLPFPFCLVRPLYCFSNSPRTRTILAGQKPKQPARE